MKKYLLFIISMLCVSIGAWADATTYKFPNSETGPSTAVLDGTVLTVTIESESDIKSSWSLPSGLSLTGVNTVKIVTATGVTLSCGNGNAMHFVYSIYGGVPVVDLSAASINLLDNTLSASTDEKMWNIVVPSSFSTSLSDLVVSSIWYSGTHYNTNNYSISGTTVNAYLGRTDHLTPLSNISSTATTLKLAEDVTGALDLSSSSVLVSGNTLDLTNVTTIADGSNGNDITVAAGVKVVCLKDGVKDRIKGTDASNITVADPVISCTALELDDKLTELRNVGVAPTSITITSGTLTTTQMTAFGSLTGLKYLSLEADAGTNIGSLSLPSTLEVLVLPKKATDTKSSVTNAMKTHANLKYIYAPYDGTRDESQMVADYVWVNKPGGLSKAFDEQAGLLSAWYMIVESTVALNDDDVNFWGSGSTARPMRYRYLDLSGANITPAVAANYRVTDQEAYRIILPNDWTGDMMNVFANIPKANRGSIAAVYSYTGTAHKRLDILEIDDYAYLSTALHDARIVREGTEEVRVISGPNYSKFGTKLLTALNSADDTPNDPETNHITSVTIAVGDGIYTSTTDADTKVASATTFAFTNPRLTKLTMNYINNKYLTINVSGCTALEELYLNETTLAGVDAHGCSKLTTASLDHAIVGGNVNLSGTKLNSLLEVDQANITGTLDVSNTSATSFDFTQLTAKKVDASNTTSLTSLNINGISLDDGWVSGDENENGKIKVTRSSNNYSDLTITKADAFNATRIIPSTGGYTTISIHEAKVEITVEGNSLTDEKVDYAVNVYNTAHASDEGYTAGDKANVKVLHVTGTLTADDITYIKNELTALQLLDLSGCTYAAGLSDLVDKIKNAPIPIPTSTAIVLPGTSNTEEGTITAVKTLQDANYECVAYYTHVAEEENPFDNNSFLNVYAYNGTIGNLISSEPAIVDSYTSITFLRKYQNTDVSSTAHGYPQATPSLLTALRTMSNPNRIPSVDMTWLDISNLGTDFSGLNSYFIIIPQNSTAEEITRNGITYNNDFTVEDDTDNGDTHVSTATYKYYKYHHNTYAVSTYKSNVAPYAANAYFGGDALSYDNGFGHKNTTATLLYLRDDNNLGSIIEYMPDHMKNAHILSIVGTINENGVEFGLNKMTNPCIDLTRATISDISILNSLDNDYVESISIPYYSVTNLEAIPANDVKGLSDLPTLSKTACTNLKGVGLLVKSNDTPSGSSSKKGRLIYKSYQEGGMANQMLMLHALNQFERKYVISRMVIGGPVNAKDISVRSNGGIDANGHLATTFTSGTFSVNTAETSGGYGTLNGYTNIEWWDFSKVTLPTYTSGDNVAEGNRAYRFNNSTYTYAADESGSFSYQNDLCYTELGLAPSTLLMDEPKLPTDESVWRLVDNALNNCHLLYNICLPWNYQYLGNGAMYGTYLQHITTTDAVGNLIDHGDHTYTLSANLKELGNKPTGEKEFVSVLVFPHDRPVYDCYALATTTPKCYRGVFAANMYYGWGGFKDASFPYCREKYQNGSNWFCVLRYPYKAAWEADHPSLSPARQTDMEFEEDDDEPMADVQKAPASRRTQQGQVNPDASYEEMKMAYTDVTKNYTKKEQTGAVDANGDAILWPTFSELRRAYNQASNNVTWNNWNATYDINHDVPEGSGTIPLDAETVTSLGTSDHNTKTGTDSGAANTDGDPYLFEDYEGWHQFVLSQATYVKPGEKQVPIDYREYEKDASWYTFCIPFDMTEEDVIKLMGVPASTDNVKTTTSTFGDHPEEESSKYQTTALLPEIRTMKSVTRTPSTTTVNIYTSKDLATDEAKKFYMTASKTYVENGTVSIDGTPKDVMIRGGYPYLIKPWKLRGTTISSLGKDIMTRYQFRAEQSSIYHSDNDKLPENDCYESFGSGTNKTGTFARPYENHKIQAVGDPGGALTHTDDDHSGQDYNYTYIGQFWKQALPLHSFYQNSKRQWRHYQNYDSRYYWNPYTCIIMVTDESTDVSAKGGKFRNESVCKYPESTGKDKQGGEVFDKALEVYYKNGLDDPFDKASARDYQFFFDEDIMDFDPDGQATAIEVLDGVRIAPIRGKVYNMAGQYVGNSLEGLSKGMYIVNGKKYVIK